MRDTRFVFVHSGEFDATVFDSQVVDSMAAVGELGIAFDLVVLMHGGPYVRKREINRRRMAEIEARIPGRVRIYPTPRKETRAGDLLASAVLLFDVLRTPARRTVLHARGDGAASYASAVRRLHPRVRSLYDARGDVMAEFEHWARQVALPDAQRAYTLAQLRREGQASVARSDRILCVSEVLRDRLHARFGGDPDRYTVIPCVADTRKFHLAEEERARTRRELGLDDRFLVIYPGRFGRWHYGPEMIALVRGLMAADPSVHFLILTPDLEEARTLAAKSLPEGRWEVRTATHAEVPRHLRAADLGLLLREPDPLNEVACPTKFAEFMLCGLPVLISAGIGDCTRFIEENAAGVVLERPDPALAVSAMLRLRDEVPAVRRARIAAAAEGKFSRQRAAQTMAALYRKLAEDGAERA
jgi:glycosyltransferase involved in cell wall biosynthesis